jgi:hypothetical protein
MRQRYAHSCDGRLTRGRGELFPLGGLGVILDRSNKGFDEATSVASGRYSMPQSARHMVVGTIGLAHSVEFVVQRLALFRRPE